MLIRSENSNEFYQQMLAYQDNLSQAATATIRNAILTDSIDYFQKHSASNRHTIRLLKYILFARINPEEYKYNLTDKFLIMQIARLHIAEGELEKAIKMYKLITKLSNEENNDVCLKIASCYRHLKKPLDTEKFLQLAHKQSLPEINSIPVTTDIKTILQLLVNTAKGQYAFVGGFVIRLLTTVLQLNMSLRPSRDIDLISTASKQQLLTTNYGDYTPEFIEAKFKNLLISVWNINQQTYLIDINCSVTQNNIFNGLNAIKRDFTICALYLFITPDLELQLVDPLGVGLQHLKEMRLEFIGDPSDEFKKDPTRALRAIKYIVLGFTPSDEIAKALLEFKIDETISEDIFNRLKKEYEKLTQWDRLDQTNQTEKYTTCVAHLEQLSKYGIDKKFMLEQRRRFEVEQHLEKRRLDNTVPMVSSSSILKVNSTEIEEVLEFYRKTYQYVPPVLVEPIPIHPSTTSLIKAGLEKASKPKSESKSKLIEPPVKSGQPPKPKAPKKQNDIVATSSTQTLTKEEKPKPKAKITAKKPNKLDKRDDDFDIMLSNFNKTQKKTSQKIVTTEWKVFEEKNQNFFAKLKLDNTNNTIKTTLKDLIENRKYTDKKTYDTLKESIFSKIKTFVENDFKKQQERLVRNLVNDIFTAYNEYEKLAKTDKCDINYYDKSAKVRELFGKILDIIPDHYYVNLFLSQIYHIASRNLIDDDGKILDTDAFKEISTNLSTHTTRLIKIAPWCAQAYYFQAVMDTRNDDNVAAHTNIDIAVECAYFCSDDADVIKEFQTDLRNQRPVETTSKTKMLKR